MVALAHKPFQRPFAPLNRAEGVEVVAAAPICTVAAVDSVGRETALLSDILHAFVLHGPLLLPQLVLTHMFSTNSPFVALPLVHVLNGPTDGLAVVVITGGLPVYGGGAVNGARLRPAASAAVQSAPPLSPVQPSVLQFHP